jgi:outer membrane lipoprotein
MKPLKRSVLLILSFAFLSGCAHVISKDLRNAADPSLTESQVKRNPEAYNGKLVVWGGEIIKTENQKDGTTIVEVFQRPLDCRGEPKRTVASEGRFLVVVDKYLDPYLYRTGKEITVAGELQGEETRPLGEMDYQYPVLLAKQIHLWDYYAYYSPYYQPWWWGPPYGFGWGWGWGFGYRHYHH